MTKRGILCITEQNRIEQNQSDVISWLRFPLVLFVVFIHTSGVPTTLQNIDYHSLSVMDFHNIILGFFRLIFSICNPSFFLFSGFLFFYKVNQWNKNTYIRKLKSRIKTLLIPYLLWNIIDLLATPITLLGGRIIKRDGDWGRFTDFFNEVWEKRIWNIFFHYSTWNDTSTNILGWSTPSRGPYSVPMWFLQTLITLSIATPLIYLICKYLKQYAFMILGTLAFTEIWFTTLAFRIDAVFYFTLGAYLSINKKNIVVECYKYRIVCYVGFIVTLLVRTYFLGLKTYDILSFVSILCGVVSGINIASYLLEHKKVKVRPLLSKSTFFIYSLHSVLVLTVVSVIFDLVFKTQNAIILTVRYFFVPITTTFICVFIYWIMKKITPKLLSLLAGNRL